MIINVLNYLMILVIKSPTIFEPEENHSIKFLKYKRMLLFVIVF